VNQDLETYRPPSWAEKLNLIPEKRIRLAQLPTPIQAWKPLCIPPHIELWIKRDDRSGIELSGNKARKLEFLLADALSQQCDCVITCGGIQSNHCRATAAAARQYGCDAFLLLRTSNPNNLDSLSGNLLLNRLLGAELIPISTEQYTRRQQLLDQLANDLKQLHRQPYIIPEGGSNSLGTWGYIEAFREIAAQIAEAQLQFDDIVFACGSGGTAAGIALATALARYPWRVHAINVCDDADYFYRSIDLLLTQLQPNVQARDIIDIIDGHKGLGYAISHRDELALIRDTAKQTCVILDPVYTGKAFYGLVRELSTNPIRFQGHRILFLHTGGLFGLYDKSTQISQLLPPLNFLSWANHL
jgi:D-cysteine desulfhydrase family pyridoxal phosphate-dependent enzyme